MRLRYEAGLILTLLFTVVAIRCQKRASTTQVIYIHASSTAVLADGSSLDTIYADLPINTLAVYRGVTFQTSSGLFENGFDTMSTFAVRTDIDPGKITAIAVWQASLRSGPDTLSAATSTIPQYVDYLTINLGSSSVDSIQLIPSSYVVKDTFGMQDSFVAVLLNSMGAKVSIGGTVVFSDLMGGVPAGGSFFPPAAVVDSSQVSTAYFPPALTSLDSSGAYITVQAQAYSATGQPVGRPTSKQIFISP